MKEPKKENRFRALHEKDCAFYSLWESIKINQVLVSWCITSHPMHYNDDLHRTVIKRGDILRREKGRKNSL